LDSGLTAVLNAHEKVLDSLQQRPASNHQELDQIQQNVRAALKRGNRRSSGNSENSSDDQNQQVGADQSAAVSADTQQAKSEAQDILRRATDALNSVPDSRRQENNGLQGAVELLAKANAAYNSGDYARSVSLAKAVLTMVQENNVLDGVNSRLNLDVQTNEGHDDGH
jgi:hypothetical protein